MSLQRVLSRMSGDRADERALRDVIELMRIHAREPLAADDVARRLERPEASVAVILSELADGYVVRRDGQRYVYEPDALTELDVQRFLRLAASHHQHVERNVTRFRNRHSLS